jgi:hypothetical protein
MKRRLTIVGTVCAVVAIVGYGIAVAATGSIGLSAGSSASVTCAGSNLYVSHRSATSVMLSCGGTSQTSTTTGSTNPPPTTTPSPVASNPPPTTAPPTTTPTTVVSNPPPTTTAYWQPPVNDELQWYLNGEINLNSTSDMGTGLTAYNGDTAPGTNPTIYDIDGIDNSAADVAALHALGAKVVCYVEIGTAGNYYSAGQEGIATSYYDQLQAAGDLGNTLAGYPERFIDINAPSAVAIVESMIEQQCAGKGFDGVETDLDETGSNNEGNTGFSISLAQNIAYDQTIATFIHDAGLAWFSKDLSDTDSASFVDALAPYAQAIIDEQASQYQTIGLDNVFVAAGKPVFDAEYLGDDTPANFCPADNAANINGTLFETNLNGPRQPCR